MTAICLALVLFVLAGFSPLWAAKTAIINGVWVANTTPQLVQAEINGRIETVVLPRFDFEGDVNGAELQNRIRTEIVKQGAVFHLYRDELGSPIRKGGMFFASDVFLKDLKMTFSAAMNNWGYKFKPGDKPAFEDPQYLLKVQSGELLLKKEGGAKPDHFGSGDGGRIITAADFLPATVLPPAVRKMHRELEQKIREIKGRPFKAEVLKVDVVRWATGKMGELTSSGLINKCSAEAQTLDFFIQPPVEPNWATPERVKALQGQPCEFIVQRDAQGREARHAGAYLLADLYFTDLAQTWEEWLQSEKLTMASPTAVPGLATGPVVIETISVAGIWKNLQSPALGLVKLDASAAGPGGEEMVRLPPPEKAISQFKELAAKLNPQIAGKPISVSMMMCADGKPYLEFGQKRVSRVYFPEVKNTLKIMMKDLAETLKP